MCRTKKTSFEICAFYSVRAKRVFRSDHILCVTFLRQCLHVRTRPVRLYIGSLRRRQTDDRRTSGRTGVKKWISGGFFADRDFPHAGCFPTAKYVIVMMHTQPLPRHVVSPTTTMTTTTATTRILTYIAKATDVKLRSVMILHHVHSAGFFHLPRVTI